VRDVHAQGRGEARELGAPVAEQRRRQDHQVRARDRRCRCSQQQQRDHLDRLAEAHVVGEATTEAEPREQPQPGDAVALVGPQGAVQGRARVGLGAAARALQLGQHAREPRARRGHGPRGRGDVLRQRPARQTGEQAHAVGEGDLAAARGGLDALPVAQRLGVARRVELDPAAAQVMEPRGAAHERAPLVRAELVVAEEVVEQRAESELGRPDGPDLDADLRARCLLMPPIRHPDPQPAVLELGGRAQQGVRLRGGPGDRVVDLAALDEVADAWAHGGGPAQRREQALPGLGVVGVLAQRCRQRDVQHAPVRPLAARDGDEEREGVRRVVLALGDMQVQTVAVRVDAVPAGTPHASRRGGPARGAPPPRPRATRCRGRAR
jgi:hypothetical protein